MPANRLSILIPSIPERMENLNTLYNKLNNQIQNYNSDGIDVEIIVFTDNKKRTIGQKRNDLITLSTGNYVMQLDDDDDVGENFIRLVCEAIVYYSPDVIAFNQLAIINNLYSIVHFSSKNSIEEFNNCGITKRPVWHCCVIKKEIALQCRFDSSLNWGEDVIFSEEVNKLIVNEHYIDEILHVYNHQDSHTTSFKEETL